MKQLLLPLTFVSLMMLSFAPAYGVSEIVLDHVTGLYNGDTINAGCSIEFTFRLTNTDGNSITGFCNGFRVWTHRNGVYTDNFSPITGDTLPLGWNDLFCLGVGIWTVSVDGVGEDTVGFGGAGIIGCPGIHDGFDEQVWWVRATPYMDGDTLCIDSSWFPPWGEWIWSTTGGTVIPAWYGPHCFLVWQCCVGIRGNVDGLAGINVADLAYLVAYLFDSGLAPPCYEEGNADGDDGINVVDLTYLVDYLFFNGPAPPPCP